MVYRTAHFSMTLKYPIPRFQGQAIFDGEYLQNRCRCGHSYYGRRIANCRQAFEWHQCAVCSVTNSMYACLQWYSCCLVLSFLVQNTRMVILTGHLHCRWLAPVCAWLRPFFPLCTWSSLVWSEPMHFKACFDYWFRYLSMLVFHGQMKSLCLQ